MIKAIKIGDKDVTFRTSGALPIIYRMLTGREFFQDIQAAGGASDRMFDIAWTMYRHGNPKDKISEEKWLEQFEFAEFNSALPDIFSMLAGEMKEASEAKKKEEQ